MSPSSRRVRASLALGVLSVSWAAILVRLADAPALAIAAWRLVLAGAAALAFALLRRRAELRALDGRAYSLLAGAGLALALHFATWISSLRLTSVASSVALVTTQPVWVALLSRALLRERIAPRVAGGIALAVLGGVAMAGGDVATGPRALAGDALALAGAIAAALYFVAGRRVRARLSAGAYVGVVYPVAALGLLALAIGAGTQLTGFGARTWTALALLALVPQLLGHSLLNWSLRWLSGTFVAVTIVAEPVMSIVLAIPVLGERPSSTQVVGGLLLLAGVALAASGDPAARAVVADEAG
ncbi:MAG TPA: DMT family transporter [Anaeromyxobacteraceae bacterium]|nr:DMT family transporter [Anaeromyxobacteraceae bacterium]